MRARKARVERAREMRGVSGSLDESWMWMLLEYRVLSQADCFGKEHVWVRKQTRERSLQCNEELELSRSCFAKVSARNAS